MHRFNQNDPKHRTMLKKKNALRAQVNDFRKERKETEATGNSDLKNRTEMGNTLRRQSTDDARVAANKAYLQHRKTAQNIQNGSKTAVSLTKDKVLNNTPDYFKYRRQERDMGPEVPSTPNAYQ